MAAVVQATMFARSFPEMKEDVREEGIITVMSHKRVVGAFISPKVLAELNELRQHRRELIKIEEAKAEFFADLDASLASYDNEM